MRPGSGVVLEIIDEEGDADAEDDGGIQGDAQEGEDARGGAGKSMKALEGGAESADGAGDAGEGGDDAVAGGVGVGFEAEHLLESGAAHERGEDGESDGGDGRDEEDPAHERRVFLGRLRFGELGRAHAPRQRGNGEW